MSDEFNYSNYVQYPGEGGYTSYTPYNNTDYYPVQQQGYYQQPYGYNPNQQFVYDPNLNPYQNPYGSVVQGGASNYSEYGGYEEQWGVPNREQPVPSQSKSYRNNRYRVRQGSRGGQKNFTGQNVPLTEEIVQNAENGAFMPSGEDRVGLTNSESTSNNRPQGETTSKPRWDNSAKYKHRSNNTRQYNGAASNHYGYQAQEFGAGMSKGQKWNNNNRPRSNQLQGQNNKGQSHNLNGDEENQSPAGKAAVKSKSKKTQKQPKPENPEEMDQRSRMIDQLTRGRYECMVCCENMRPDTAVWQCSNCYHLFHLFCIKKWARSSTALVEGGNPDGWRCPACQNITEKVPNAYKCFCGKIRDPVYNRYETPHSCGDVCNRNRKGDCQHPCTLLCHPGACPPCSATVTKSCDCGQIKQTVRCGLNIGLKCDNKCGKTLNCLKHDCLVVCHSGGCQSCDQFVSQECYGKHTSRDVLCGSHEDQEMSYSCRQQCNRILECGNHRCESECHPGECAPCSLLPDQVTYCPCGRTLLTELFKETRSSCLTPVPTCDKTCKKTLKCGPTDRHHQCKKVCHEAECPPCEGSTKVKCVCKATEKTFPCTKSVTFDETNPFICDKKCTKKRMCGRHKCGEVCCNKDEHICEVKCNRKLTCGKHKCGRICHPGNCQPCYDASFDELTCHCGSEVIFPPVACGTLPPECNKVCRRRHDCNHTVRHNCHSEDKCPPCTELGEKRCVGGHEIRKNIPCHLKDIVCGYPCGKLLSCGKHKCKQTCHKGDCLGEDEVCSQSCDIKREECGHPCGTPCHPDLSCPKVPCKTEVLVKCICGNKQGKTLCLLGGEDLDNTDYQKVSVESWMNQGTVEISQIKKGAKRELDCDTDCAKLERNRRMALALEIENPDLQSKLTGTPYPDLLKDFARKNPERAITVERTLYDLVTNAKQSKYPSRSHSFPSMNREGRQFVHELAAFYGCETQSYDNEPKKNVVATAYKNRCYLPTVGISSFAPREQTITLPPPTVVGLPGRRFGAMTTLRSLNSRSETGNQSEVRTPTSGQSERKPETSSKPREPVINYFDFSVS